MKEITIYADESGTHDEDGKQKGSELPVIAGFAAPTREWDRFCSKWRQILDAYGAPYFHFSEWAAASAAIRYKKAETEEFRKNPYYKWNIRKLDQFLLSLAKVAGSGNKTIIAGVIKMNVFNRIKHKIETDDPKEKHLIHYPYVYCMSEFFKVYHRETYYRWGDFKSHVSFIFDQTDNPKWKEAMHRVFFQYEKMDTRLKAISFADKMKKLPLQAADMLAYRLRQTSQKLSENAFVPKDLDEILLKNLRKTLDNTNYINYPA